jgi:succinate dehydrogenase / fumarate reductase cytochrome b subunit
MAILGTLILFFLIIHLKDFWLKTRITGLTGEKHIFVNGVWMENLYSEMRLVFTELWVVIVYLF